VSDNGITNRQWAGAIVALSLIGLVFCVGLRVVFPVHTPATTVHASSIVESPTVSSDCEWPPTSLYAGFDSTLAQGQIGKTKLIDALTANVCIGYLESMLTEYEFVGDLIPVTPVMVSREARAQFCSRFSRLEEFKTINMDGISIDARLRLLRRYVNLVNRGLDAADQASRTEVNFPN